MHWAGQAAAWTIRFGEMHVCPCLHPPVSELPPPTAREVCFAASSAVVKQLCTHVFGVFAYWCLPWSSCTWGSSPAWGCDDGLGWDALLQWGIHTLCPQTLDADIPPPIPTTSPWLWLHFSGRAKPVRHQKPQSCENAIPLT